MGLKEVFQAIREYPAACSELQRSQQALEQSEQKRRSLELELGEQTHHLRFLSQRSAALQAALDEFCPRVSTLGDMKQLYNTISPHLDPKGFTLYHMAERITGIDVPSFFPYDDNRGLFAEMDGHQLMPYLKAAYFHAVDWTIVPGAAYEKAALRKVVDTSTPEYQAFERELYEKTLERMGFGNILAPDREVNAIGDKVTELRLYSPLSGELIEPGYDRPRPMDGKDLAPFQDVILQGIEDQQLIEEAERGLMLYYDGPSAVDEKALSFFPSVEKVDGELYGVAVFKINGTLDIGELEELKDYCRTQYNYAFGESFARRPQRTEYGNLHVSFYIDNISSILTKEEMEADRIPNSPLCQPKKERGGHDGR